MAKSNVTSPSENFNVENQQLQKFAQHLLVQRGLGRYTISGYRRMIAKVLRDLETMSPTYDQIELYIANMHKKGFSYHHILNTSLAIERYTEWLGQPVKLGRPRKPKRIIPKTLSEAEVAIILNACKNIREKAILSLVAYTGIRNKELCGLRVSDVDFGNNSIRVIGGKGAKDRVVCVSGACVNIILKYLKAHPRNENSYLFTTLADGFQYSGGALRKLVRTVVARTNINRRVYPHLLRHSLATNLIDRGANIITVKEQLGHVFLDTTMAYVTSRYQRIAAEYTNFAPSYL